ncbi:MAG: menaquinone biosynthesis decarboxylase [Fimbriimonadaceae bacterium]|nr:menaquinone biosynthesis decarboxylase [Fimbriimonadaceae bacterium]
MSFATFPDFLHELERLGELRRIRAEVDPVLEITAIADRCVKRHGPALLFENVKGSRLPVAINTFASLRRICLALGVESLDSIGAEIERLVTLPQTVGKLGLGDKLRLGFEALGLLPKLKPRIVGKGRCQEVVRLGSDARLSELPVLQCWPQDGGRFITLPLVFTRDRRSGARNCGMYRMQVYDDQTTGMHWHLHKGSSRSYQDYEASGEKMEVAVALGGDPVLTYCATAPLPDGFDEMMLAGFLRKQAVEMVPCKTVDLQVPASAEIILEGYVAPGERRREGPFGDHTGFYSLADDYPVFHLTALTHTAQPLYPTIVVGKPPMEDTWLGRATERIFLPLLKLTMPEVVDYAMPLAGVFHNCVVVSIDKRYPQHARKICYAIWGTGQMMFTKFIVVVDQHVNVHDEQEVMWHVWNSVDPRRDTFVVDGPLDVLDHTCPQPAWGSKMGIDATTKWASEGFAREWPAEIAMSPEVEARVQALWPQLGLDLAPAPWELH